MNMLPCLWLARVDGPLPTGCEAWTEASEVEQLGLMRDPLERRRRAIAWILRRWALTRARPEIAEVAWRFTAGHHGKPELAAPFDNLGLRHNLSHGGSYAAVLVADAPCGVDVEAPTAGLEVAEVVFGAAERAEIAAHPRPAERFLQHWVAKEAALKLLGVGFGAAPEALELTLAPDGRSALPRSSTGDRLRLPPGTTVRLWPLPNGHWLAAALPDPAAEFEPAFAPWSSA